MNFTSLEVTEGEGELLESITYNQPVTATQLIALTGHHRKVVYDMLKRLESRALLVSQKLNNKRLYSFSGPARIQEEIQEVQRMADRKIADLQTLKQDLQDLPPTDPIDAYTISGKLGVRYALTALLELNEDYVTIGAPVESETIMGEHFWLNFHARQKELNIGVRNIFNNNLRDWSNKSNNPNVRIRYFSELEPLSETIICKDHVFNIIWTQTPQVHIIQNKNYAAAQREYFETLWENAQK